MASLRVRLPLRHRGHLGAQEFHAEDVEGLTLDVLFAHIDLAFEPEYRRRRGSGDAMLSGTGFGNDAPLSHAAGQQRLTESVIDLVRAGVVEVFTLQENACATQMFAEAAGKVERRGSADVRLQIGLQFRLESWVCSSPRDRPAPAPRGGT